MAGSGWDEQTAVETEKTEVSKFIKPLVFSGEGGGGGTEREDSRKAAYNAGGREVRIGIYSVLQSLGILQTIPPTPHPHSMSHVCGMAYIKSHSLFQYFLYLITNFLN